MFRADLHVSVLYCLYSQQKTRALTHFHSHVHTHLHRHAHTPPCLCLLFCQSFAAQCAVSRSADLDLQTANHSSSDGGVKYACVPLGAASQHVCEVRSRFDVVTFLWRIEVQPSDDKSFNLGELLAFVTARGRLSVTISPPSPSSTPSPSTPASALVESGKERLGSGTTHSLEATAALAVSTSHVQVWDVSVEHPLAALAFAWSPVEQQRAEVEQGTGCACGASKRQCLCHGARFEAGHWVEATCSVSVLPLITRLDMQPVQNTGERPKEHSTDDSDDTRALVDVRVSVGDGWLLADDPVQRIAVHKAQAVSFTTTFLPLDASACLLPSVSVYRRGGNGDGHVLACAL